MKAYKFIFLYQKFFWTRKNFLFLIISVLFVFPLKISGAIFLVEKNDEKWSLPQLERDKLFLEIFLNKKQGLIISGIVIYSGVIITSVYDNYVPEASWSM